MNQDQTITNLSQIEKSQDCRHPPYNLEAEQALLGAILVDNNALKQVSDFLTADHFFDPLHVKIYSTLESTIKGGKLATPIILKNFFDDCPPINAHMTVAQYLGSLVANATTIINAGAYGRTVIDDKVGGIAARGDFPVVHPVSVFKDEYTISGSNLNKVSLYDYYDNIDDINSSDKIGSNNNNKYDGRDV